jgi:hypothetical protein
VPVKEQLTVTSTNRRTRRRRTTLVTENIDLNKLGRRNWPKSQFKLEFLSGLAYPQMFITIASSILLSGCELWFVGHISSVNPTNVSYCAQARLSCLNTVHPRPKRNSLQKELDNKLTRKIFSIALLCYTCWDNNTPKTHVSNTTKHETDIAISGYFITLCMYECIFGVPRRAALPQYIQRYPYS